MFVTIENVFFLFNIHSNTSSFWLFNFCIYIYTYIHIIYTKPKYNWFYIKNVTFSHKGIYIYIYDSQREKIFLKIFRPDALSVQNTIFVYIYIYISKKKSFIKYLCIKSKRMCSLWFGSFLFYLTHLKSTVCLNLIKIPTKTRVIIAAPKCSLKPLSKSITRVFKLMFKQIEICDEQSSSFLGIKSFWRITSYWYY